MFRAIDTSGRDHISLAISPDARARYYGMADDNELICPACLQPLWFKGGEVREFHFAHKDRGKCPMESESAAILRARAAIYRLLASKFGDRVRIEKRIDGATLPRVIDCFVEADDGTTHAYWLIESRLKDRHEIRHELHSRGVQVHWVFLSDMMQRNGKPCDILNLTPTERELLSASAFDELHRPSRHRSEAGSIHYVDASKGVLTTFRGMVCTEYPQEYAGKEISSQLDLVLVDERHGGDFYHPGEFEALEAARLAKEQAEARRRAEQEAEKLAREAAQARRLEETRRWQESLPPVDRPIPLASSRRQTGNDPSELPDRSPYDLQALPCVLCGRVTDEWWMKFTDGDSIKCKCKACLKAGKS
jgi:hypothetical protein